MNVGSSSVSDGTILFNLPLPWQKPSFRDMDGEEKSDMISNS
jgi:hypothetical protein